jgi:hypothetical protein
MPDISDRVAQLTIYSRPGCHLCEDMKAVVERVGRKVPIRLEEINIEGDQDLERRYGAEIPVLMIEGRKAAKFRIAEEALLRALRGPL